MVMLMCSYDKRVEGRIGDNLALIWEDLNRELINKAIKNFTNKLVTCVGAGGGHIKYNVLKHKCF